MTLETSLIFLKPISAVLAFLIALWASSHAILKKRDPRAALWWVMVVWLLPFLGSVLYYFFGINRIQRKATRLRRVRHRLVPSPTPYLTKQEGEKNFYQLGHLVSLSRLVEDVVHLPLTRGNRITPLMNGDQAYPAMLKAINEAKHSIGLSTYIFNNDATGKMFIEALSRAHERKVQVRVLIDDVGAGFSWLSVHRQLKAHRIPVAYFLPTFAPWRMAYINLRNHRKILTVDGRWGFTGGMNISGSHILGNHPKHPAEDLHFQLEGPVVAQMQEAFRVDWHFTTGEDLNGEVWFPEIKENGFIFARGVADGPDEDFEKCRWTILGALAHARKSVRIITPYLLPDHALMTSLNIAAMSGVHVDILLPSVNDLALVHWASQATLWQILERGCRVWMTPPPFNHAKLMLVDGGWTLLGSTNWDPRSLRLNFEFNVECYDTLLTGRLEDWFDQKKKQARKLTMKEMDSRPLPIKLRDGAARLLVPNL